GPSNAGASLRAPALTGARRDHRSRQTGCRPLRRTSAPLASTCKPGDVVAGRRTARRCRLWARPRERTSGACPYQVSSDGTVPPADAHPPFPALPPLHLPPPPPPTPPAPPAPIMTHLHLA